MINQEALKSHEEVTYARFNQDCTCLVVGTSNHGFYIYKLNPKLQLIYSSAAEDTIPMQCICVEMYYTSNILAIVQAPAKSR